MRILFMGTPDFAVPSLSALYRGGHRIVGIFTRPDKPKNRGMKLQPPPVKEWATANMPETPVFQPEKLRDGTALAKIKEWDPELIVVAAYGRILPDDILAYPPKGCINVHSSLLPKYRGAAPINWAILNGEKELGVTIMHMAHDLDAGDIIAQRVLPGYTGSEDAETATRALAALGAELLTDVVAQIEAGTAARTHQDHSRATLAPMLSKELSPMDFTRPAQALFDQVRGLYPWPAAVTELGGVRCKVLRAAVAQGGTDKAPGTVVQADKRGLRVACGEGTVLELLTLQPDGKKTMEATAFLLGHPLTAN